MQGERGACAAGWRTDRWRVARVRARARDVAAALERLGVAGRDVRAGQAEHSQGARVGEEGRPGRACCGTGAGSKGGVARRKTCSVGHGRAEQRARERARAGRARQRRKEGERGRGKKGEKKRKEKEKWEKEKKKKKEGREKGKRREGEICGDPAGGDSDAGRARAAVAAAGRCQA